MKKTKKRKVETFGDIMNFEGFVKLFGQMTVRTLRKGKREGGDLNE